MYAKFFLLLILVSTKIVVTAQQRNFTLSQFVFEDTAGNKYNLDSLKGKTVFIDCWFVACPPCRQEMPYSFLLQKRLHAMKMDSNIVFVTINFKQTKQEWLQALQMLQMPKAVHLNSPASTYEITLASGNYPTYRIFNKQGNLDIEFAPRPSEFLKADFVLFATSKGQTVTNAIKIYEQKNEKNKHPLLKEFFEKEAPLDKQFIEEYLQVK